MRGSWIYVLDVHYKNTFHDIELSYKEEARYSLRSPSKGQITQSKSVKEALTSRKQLRRLQREESLTMTPESSLFGKTNE
ncbi:hypothetical protein CN326_04325 [Bacillus sp. AFS018417]|nr:hypothetical protein CN326_04325 [Bacillus sp. AFS018417]